MAPAEPAAAVTTCIALSFNGRTDDSDSSNRGSNPWGATKRNKAFKINKMKLPSRDSNRSFDHHKKLKVLKFLDKQIN